MTKSLLVPISDVYRAIISFRNAAFDRTSAQHQAAVPVISIGNITAGGTGKTPFVIEICSRLVTMGRKPAILTRGYKARRGQEADEVLEFRAALPAVPVVVDADRVRGAERAVREFGADVLVMDDGFQHRRLARDLDIVLIDALDPWGGGRLLPAGRLREPLKNLRRAHLLVISRANQVERGDVDEVERRLREFAPAVPVIRATVVAESAASIPDRVLGVCGLGNPESFRRSLHEFSAHAELLTFRDHCRYSSGDARKIIQAARSSAARVVLVSRKDWVKLAPLWPTDAGIELQRLDMRIEIHDPDGVLSRMLRRCHEQPG
jgi:tetraacyldisaccharide 4'-kinase